MMNAAKRKKLEAAGWRVGSAQEFLSLSEEESVIVGIKLALADAVKKQREKRNLTQIELAAMMRSSQSRIAEIEAGDPSVSLDLLVRAALAAGATRKDIAKALAEG
ncbi:MAG: helix-turn-helix transcriptional regulator [Acidobacteriota bacterium]